MVRLYTCNQRVSPCVEYWNGRVIQIWVSANSYMCIVIGIVYVRIFIDMAHDIHAITMTACTAPLGAYMEHHLSAVCRCTCHGVTHSTDGQIVLFSDALQHSGVFLCSAPFFPRCSVVLRRFCFCLYRCFLIFSRLLSTCSGAMLTMTWSLHFVLGRT